MIIQIVCTIIGGDEAGEIRELAGHRDDEEPAKIAHADHETHRRGGISPWHAFSGNHAHEQGERSTPSSPTNINTDRMPGEPCR